VRAWDRREVKIEGSLGQGVEKLEILGDAQHLSVKVKYPRPAALASSPAATRANPRNCG
jgi:hypothetical protein